MYRPPSRFHRPAPWGLGVFSKWFEWLKSLLNKYPNCWIKNEWAEEGGTAGVWIGYVKDNENIIKELEWNDICAEGQYYLFMDEEVLNSKNLLTFYYLLDRQNL